MSQLANGRIAKAIETSCSTKVQFKNNKLHAKEQVVAHAENVNKSKSTLTAHEDAGAQKTSESDTHVVRHF